MAHKNGGCVRLLHAVDELAYMSGFDHSGHLLEAARSDGGRNARRAPAVAEPGFET